jgi:hypothetical protein
LRKKDPILSTLLAVKRKVGESTSVETGKEQSEWKAGRRTKVPKSDPIILKKAVVQTAGKEGRY